VWGNAAWLVLTSQRVVAKVGTGTANAFVSDHSPQGPKKPTSNESIAPDDP